MKRPSNESRPILVNGTRDPREDLSIAQRAAFGDAILAYNLLEDGHAALFWVMSQLTGMAERASKARHIDERTACILHALRSIPLEAEDAERIREALARFEELKAYRNAMVHCRIIDASIGVGRSDGQKGEPSEILLTEEALDLLYWHLVWSERELSSAISIIIAVSRFNELSDDDSRKRDAAQHLRVHRGSFYSNSGTRRRLRPLPDFPTEVEMEVAMEAHRRAQQAKLSEWLDQFRAPRKIVRIPLVETLIDPPENS
jgi:hypothetical protein